MGVEIMKKRLIDAEHLKGKIERAYGSSTSNGSWYDLVRTMAIIDAEPTEHQSNDILVVEIALGITFICALVALKLLLFI
jgi:hypothetical protein